jgi:chloramphenicol-sensitive protein RarD
LVLGIGAYLWWGFLPLYLNLLHPAGAVEVIAHRVLWSLVACGVLLRVVHQGAALRRAVSSPRSFGLLTLCGALLVINWLTFVYAVLSGHVVDGALGYFINPLFSVALGVVLLHERLRPAQWVALGIAATAVVVIGVSAGHVPWIALALALSWGFYGYTEKKVGVTVPVVAALTVETCTMAPLAGAYVIWLGLTGGQSFTGYGTWHALAMAGLGVVTVVPLLLFNGAARRLPLTVVGMLQYLNPTLQFLTGVFLFHEVMPPARWFGFAVVWIALVILGVDGLRAGRVARAGRSGRRSGGWR